MNELDDLDSLISAPVTEPAADSADDSLDSLVSANSSIPTEDSPLPASEVISDEDEEDTDDSDENADGVLIAKIPVSFVVSEELADKVKKALRADASAHNKSEKAKLPEGVDVAKENKMTSRKYAKLLVSDLLEQIEQVFADYANSAQTRTFEVRTSALKQVQKDLEKSASIIENLRKLLKAQGLSDDQIDAMVNV